VVHLGAVAEFTTTGKRWPKKWELIEVTSDTYPKYNELGIRATLRLDGMTCSDSAAALTSRHHKFIAVFVPPLHHLGAPGVQVLFVTHGATRDQVVPASLPHSRLGREIRSKRHLRTLLSDALNWGMLGYGCFSNI
jgi:hypothetical protein